MCCERRVTPETLEFLTRVRQAADPPPYAHGRTTEQHLAELERHRQSRLRKKQRLLAEALRR